LFIVVPAMVQVSQALVYQPDGAGNITVHVSDSGANSVDTGFGFAPVIPPNINHTIVIDAGASLNPTGTDVVQVNVFNSVNTTYTITNNGVLISDGGPANYGISTADIAVLATPSIVVLNNGSVSGAGAIRANNQLTLTNTGTLTGTSGVDAAVFAKNGGSVTNSNTITGVPYGIRTEAGNLVVNNNGTGSIQGTAGIGIGVSTLGSLTLTNGQNLSGSTALVHGGFEGINAGANSSITNNQFASITGGANGVTVAGGSTVTNFGTITGTSGFGILGDAGAQTVDNYLLIYGGAGGISLLGGNDIVNLHDGSVVNASVNGGTGINTLNLDGGLTGLFVLEDGTQNVVHGSVTGFAVINKTGNGAAFLGAVGESVTVHADAISVTGGGLYINGNLSGDTVLKTAITASGSELGGVGVWNANIAVTAGALSAGASSLTVDATPLNTVGILTLTGNVTHSPGSYIRFDVLPQTTVSNGFNSDLIVQTGVGNTYDVNGAGIHLAPTNINRTLTNGVYTVVDSATPIVNAGSLGPISVEFNAHAADTGPFRATETATSGMNTVLANYFTTPGLADGGTNLTLTVQHHFAGLPGLTANQASLGAALDASANTSNPLLQDFIAALDYSNLGAVKGAIAALDPSTYLDLTASVVNSNYRLHRISDDHLAEVRDGSESHPGYARTQVGTRGATVESPPVAAEGGNSNVWGTLSYDWQDYSGRSPASDFDGTSSSFTAGFDWRLSPDLVLGVLVDGSHSELDHSGGNSDIDSLRGAIYGTWGRSTGFYSNALVGYGSHEIDSTNAFGGIIGGAGRADVNATSFQAMLTAGYTFEQGAIKHGPFVGVEYQDVEVDGFTVGGPLPIGVGDSSLDSLRGLIGYRVSASYERFHPYASIAYAHEFQGNGQRATATLPNGAPFTVIGADLNSAFLITAGTGITLAPSLILDIGYRGEISSESQGLDSHGGSVGLKYNF